MTTRLGISKSVFATAGLLVFSTINWLLWGLATPGDYFANGSTWLIGSSFLFGAFGLFVGARIRQRKGKTLLLVCAAACLLFWGLARNGWWAHPPPSGKSRGSE
jgi:hypothetical protein